MLSYSIFPINFYSKYSILIYSDSIPQLNLHSIEPTKT